MQSGGGLMGQMRRYVWNRTTLSAILIASPAIFSSITTFVMANSLDRRAARITAEKEMVNRDLGSLDGQVKAFETLQLSRGALLLVLNGARADQQSKYQLDRLFRLNAKQAMRRIVALVHPQDWQARMAPYDALVDREYIDPKTVQALQAIENDTVQEAGRRLVTMQETYNFLARRVDKLESRKVQMTAILASLTSALTIVIFFFTTNRKKPEAG